MFVGQSRSNLDQPSPASALHSWFGLFLKALLKWPTSKSTISGLIFFFVPSLLETILNFLYVILDFTFLGFQIPTKPGLISKIWGYQFCSNVWCNKNRTKLISVLLLWLVRFLMRQTLKYIVSESKPQAFHSTTLKIKHLRDAFDLMPRNIFTALSSFILTNGRT